MKRFLEIKPAGQMGLIAIRFYACGAYLFFQRPLSEVAAGIVDLEDIWKERASELTPLKPLRLFIGKLEEIQRGSMA